MDVGLAAAGSRGLKNCHSGSFLRPQLLQYSKTHCRHPVLVQLQQGKKIVVSKMVGLVASDHGGKTVHWTVFCFRLSVGAVPVRLLHQLHRDRTICDWLKSKLRKQKENGYRIVWYLWTLDSPSRATPGKRPFRSFSVSGFLVHFVINEKNKDRTFCPVFIFLAPQVGLEPTTSWLTVTRSTDWAIGEYLKASTSLSSQDVSIQVFSALLSLTSVFGMGTGGSWALSALAFYLGSIALFKGCTLKTK